MVTTDVGDVRRWVSLAVASAVAERNPDAIARALVTILSERRREDPTPFVSAFSLEVLALADAATAAIR